MGSGSAKSARLDFGIDLRKRVHMQGGTDEDIQLVREEAPDFLNTLAIQLLERARIIRGDRDCFRLMHDEVVIEIPALKRPTLPDLKRSWGYIREIERDDSTEEPLTLRLATVLKSDESLIPGTVYERRIEPLRNAGKLLGFQHRQWLLENQHKFPALTALLEKVYIDFPGIVVVYEDGHRIVPYASQSGGRLDGRWIWFDFGFSESGRIAVSGSPR
ncbi:MAG: hypothetical protein AAB518_01020 [Patescibacteria group bacterium]